MIRVVSGTYKRRILKQPDASITRPTKDVAKEGLFSSLGDIKGLTFLDLFSGSGAIGIEAYSRGATRVYLNDKNDESIKVIKDNLSSLKINDIVVTKLDYEVALKSYASKNIKFDIIFLDPPYKMIIDLEFIKKILSYNILNKDALIVIETDYPLEESINETFDVKVLKYGRSLMNILRNV